MKKLSAFFLFISFFFGCTSLQKEKKLSTLVLEGSANEAREKLQIKRDVNETDKDGNTALHAAAIVNDADTALFLIIKGSDVFLQNKNGETPLHLAIQNGSYETAEIISKNSDAIFAKNADGVSALSYGLSHDPRFYAIFITKQNGAKKDTDGNSIVHYFAKEKNLRAIQESIKLKLPLSLKNNDGQTPLDLAFAFAKDAKGIEVAAELLRGGAERESNEYEYFQTAIVEHDLNYRFQDGQTPLHLAVIKEDEAIVQYLLENGADAGVQDITGSTPLHESCRKGNVDIARLLLEAGANVNAEDNLNKTPLMVLIPKENRTSVYDVLLSHGADVLHKDSYGDTVLHTGVLTNLELNLLENFLSKGADINARNKDGFTPLAIAIQNKNEALILFFTKHNADIMAEDKNGNTPLSLALSNKNIIELIVNKNNVYSLDSLGNTPLHTAIAKNADIAEIKYIASFMENVNMRNKDGNSALYLAVQKNNREAGELLLAKNADIFSANTKNDSPLQLALSRNGDEQAWLINEKTISARDGSGNTVLHYAADWKIKSAVSSLIEKGANVEAKNANGETAIFNATKSNAPEIIHVFLKAGENISVRDNLGNSLLHIAARWNAIDAVLFLLKNGIDINAQNLQGKSSLAESCLSGKISIAELLIKYGADINASDKTGKTILMDAINAQNISIVKLLLENNANPQIQEIGGKSAYHEAALSKNAELISLVKKYGGAPLARDKKGNTPFSLCFKENDEIIRAVLGSDTGIADSDGNTPVHIAAQSRGNERILNLLIKLHFPIDTRNRDGKSPLSYAVENSNVKYARIFLQHGANPFIALDKKGKNAATIALENNRKEILRDMAQYAGNKSDIQGNTLLHYAARIANADTIQRLLSFGLNANAKNISGETPSMTARRWKRSGIAEIFQTAETKE